MDNTTTTFYADGQSVISFNGAVDVKKGEVVYLKRDDRRQNHPFTQFNFEEIELSRWKVVSVSRSIEEIVSTNEDRSVNPIPFKIRCSCNVDVEVKPYKTFRFWIRPKVMRDKKFWLDSSRLKEHNIIELMWFGVSYS